jgi:phosphate transport system permease protein
MPPQATSSGIRERVQAASARIARVKRMDRLATATITLGGLFIIVGVSFILFFILAEALPLFRAASATPLSSLKAPAAVAAEPPLAVGVDEYQRYLYELTRDARVVFLRGSDGSLAKDLPIESLAGSPLVSGSRSLQGDFVAAGTADGRVALLQVRFKPRYEEQKLVDLDLELRERGLVAIDPLRRPIREVSYQEREGRKAVAALLADDEIAIWRQGEDEAEHLDTVRTKDGEKVTHLRLGRTDTLVAATERGNLYLWELGTEVSGPEVTRVAAGPVTAVEYTLGSNSLLVGDHDGSVSAWFRVRQREEDNHWTLVQAHTFAPQGSGVRAIAPGPRDKSFATIGADGSVVLRHLTSERVLLRLSGGRDAASALITPKADGLLVRQADGTVARWSLANPHPEVSWQALFGQVWYEGYAAPAHVWQSTGANDDFEAKFSLFPLVFGTIKGTLYALIFAVPISICGALYTSQFVHPSIKARIKPTVEIMAALPSVVVGFVAGLWLASRVERQIVPVLLMLVLLPLFGSAGLLAWDRLPHGLARRLRPGMEVFLIVPALLLGAAVCVVLGPGLESILFQGDFKLWLKSALDLVYDQRNCLVVGIAMGFAVIPIIFTISEDAFSSVPSHLTAASLALGASRWQTAVRVVLPTASPGIFSAVMVGFGRAVGETMIVLMATGNTPVLDWSVFNGMRTLSANIAVEIPEAPSGGTLYRVLFLAAGVLFLMTFVVNTAAELIRQRLRERYRAL